MDNKNMVMKKVMKFSYISLLLLFMKTGVAQIPLNEVSDFGYHQQNPRSMLIVDDQLYVSGIALRKDNGQEREFFVSRIGKYLKPQDHFILDDDNNQLTLQNESHDLIHHQGKFYTIASETDFGNTENEFASVIEYDPNTNIARHYIKEDTLINGFPLFPSTILSDIANDDILVLYDRLTDLQLNTIRLVRYDRISKVILDEFKYEEAGKSVSGAEIIVGDEGYTLIGRRQFTNGSPSEIIVFRLNKQLELENSVTFNNYNYFDIYIDAIEARDGGIVFQSSESIGEFPRDSFRKKILKLDPNLNLQWEVNFGNPTYTRDFLTTTEIINSSQDAGYLICGYLDHGVIGKISEEGDSIWFRTYEPVNEDQALFSHFTDIVTTDSGEYIVAGQSAPESFATDSIFFKMWMIKINEDGRIINRDTTGVSKIDVFDERLRIFPNPTADLLYIEQDDIKTINYEMYDQKGKLILKKDNTEAYHTYIISLQDYSAGIYFLHIIDEKGNRIVKEIVIAK